jgi:hypothetical protein
MTCCNGISVVVPEGGPLQDEGLFHMGRDELRMRNKLFLLAVWERLACKSLDSVLHHVEHHPCSLFLLHSAGGCDELQHKQVL